jgi:ATP-binding cassette, subfamily C, bacterial exporter for protease/lipase
MTTSAAVVLTTSQILGRLRATWVTVVVSAMLANVLMLTPTLYMLNIYDRVFVSESVWTLVTMSGLALALLSVMALAEWLRSRQLISISRALDEWLSHGVFEASYQSQLHAPGSRDTNKAFSDLTELRQFITGQGIFALLDVPWTPIYIAVLFLLHPVLGWSAIFFLLLQLALATLSYRMTQPLVDLSGSEQIQLQRFTSAHMRDLEASHAMGEQPTVWTRWQRLATAASESHGQGQSLINATTALSKWLRYAQQSLILGIGALLVIRGELTAGAMIASNVLTLRALTPVDQLVQAWRPFLNAKQAYRRLQQLLEPGPKPTTQADTEVESAEPAGWVLRDVCVHASESNHPILDDVTLSINAGRLLVVLGASGSGKTTLARTLVGACQPTRGSVWIANQALHKWCDQHSSTQMGYLPQDIELFEGSVAQNIARLGEVDSNAVVKAAQAAGLHDLILHLPNGYDTPIGDGGRTLSGGQRQRIALARALYRSPPYLVLDEPNSHLDDAGESALAESLKALKAEGTTIVLITHRPQILAIADDVLVLHQGRVHLHGDRAHVVSELQRLHAQKK